MAKKQNRKEIRVDSPFSKGFRKIVSEFEKTDRIFLISIITVAVLFAVQLAVFTSSYQTNDDIGMTFLVSGKGTCPSPDEHLRYSHVFIGLLLKFLYSVTDAVPWYGMYHFAVHFLAMAALLYAVLSIEKSLMQFMFFILYFLVVEMYFLTNLQFTITACIAVQSAVVFYASAVAERRTRCWLFYLFSLFFFLLGYMIRSNAFLLIMLLSLPLISHVAWNNRKDRIRTLQNGLFWTLVIIAVFGLRTYERSYYDSEPGWRDFFEFNSLKSRIIDYDHISYTPENQHIFDEAGWSRNDFYTFRSWFFADEKLFSTEKVRQIAEQFPPYSSSITFQDIMSQVGGAIAEGWLFIIVAVYFFLFVKSGRGQRRSVLATLVLTLLLMAFLVYTKRLPARVFQPMLSFFAVVCLYFSDRRLKDLSEPAKIINSVFLVFFAVAVIYGAVQMREKSRTVRENSRRFKASVQEVNPQKDHVYIVWGASLPYTSILPFDTMAFMDNFKLVSLGTTLRTPVTKARMKKFGIDNLYTAPYERDNVYFIVRNITYFYLYTQFVKEHYDVDIKFRYTYESSDFNVVQVGIR